MGPNQWVCQDPAYVPIRGGGQLGTRLAASSESSGLGNLCPANDFATPSVIQAPALPNKLSRNPLGSLAKRNTHSQPLPTRGSDNDGVQPVQNLRWPEVSLGNSSWKRQQPKPKMASPYGYSAYAHKSGLSMSSPSVSSRTALRVPTEEKMHPRKDGKGVFLKLWVFELVCFAASVSSLIGELAPADLYLLAELMLCAQLSLPPFVRLMAKRCQSSPLASHSTHCWPFSQR